MNRADANKIAYAVANALTDYQQRRLKAIHIHPRLHDGMLTIRVHMANQAADEPEFFIFSADELS